eukprot:SAG22_NODE_914_length_6519_cov_1.701713_4_plen_52_part_00
MYMYMYMYERAGGSVRMERAGTESASNSTTMTICASEPCKRPSKPAEQPRT